MSNAEVRSSALAFGVHSNFTSAFSIQNSAFFMPQFIYTMKGLGKVHQPDHVVLKDIWLSFLPGAKIGVLGLNGAGKSSLLRIMAGEDTRFLGEAFPAEGISVGMLHQEPQLDPTKTVLGNVEEGVAEVRALLDALRRDQRQVRRRPVARRNGQGARRTGARAGSDRSGQRVGPRLSGRARDGCAAAPAARRRPEDAVRRRAAPRRAVPAAAAFARPAAARRADQPPRCRIGRVARALPQGLRRHGRRGDPRSLLPRQRRRVDPRAGSRIGHPLGGELLVVARSEAAAPGGRGETGNEAATHAATGARLDPHVAARQAGEGEGQAQRLRRSAARKRRRRRSSRSKSTFRLVPGSATSSSKRAACAKATATCC